MESKSPLLSKEWKYLKTNFLGDYRRGKSVYYILRILPLFDLIYPLS